MIAFLSPPPNPPTPPAFLSSWFSMTRDREELSPVGAGLKSVKINKFKIKRHTHTNRCNSKKVVIGGLIMLREAIEWWTFAQLRDVLRPPWTNHEIIINKRRRRSKSDLCIEIVFVCGDNCQPPCEWVQTLFFLLGHTPPPPSSSCVPHIL